MNRHNRFTMAGSIAASLAVLAMFALNEPAQAKKPFTAAEAEDQKNALLAVVAKGDALWHSGSLGTNGLACANCHPDGAAANTETWPKFQTNLGKVGTLREMINWCIQVPLEGKAIGFESDEMIALEAYAAYTSRGIALAPGKDYQSGAAPVKSGPGYPTGKD